MTSLRARLCEPVGRVLWNRKRVTFGCKGSSDRRRPWVDMGLRQMLRESLRRNLGLIEADRIYEQVVATGITDLWS